MEVCNEMKFHQVFFHQTNFIIMLSRSLASLAATARLASRRAAPMARFYSQNVDESPNFSENHLYPQPNTFVPSNTAPVAATNRPIPLNVALTDVAVFKHPTTHGNKVAEITLASFMSTKDLDFYSDFLLRAAFYLKIPAKGPTPLPRKYKKWTVIRSPFVQAKSKQNFERVTYRRVIKLYDANPEVVQILLSIANKYPLAGVGVKAVLYTNESIDVVNSMDLPSSFDLENPLAINKVHLDAADGEVAQKVLELLKDPRFAEDLVEEKPATDKQ